jgi:hypothetical protein
VKYIRAVVLPWLVAGCAFSGPLGTVEDRVFDERLLGSWIEVEPDDKDRPARLQLSRGEGEISYVLRAELPDWDPFRSDKRATGTIQLTLDAFTVIIDSLAYLNVLSTEEKEEWHIFRYGFADDSTIVVAALEPDSPARALAPAELRQYVRGNRGNPDIFGDSMLFRRVAAP